MTKIVSEKDLLSIKYHSALISFDIEVALLLGKLGHKMNYDRELQTYFFPASEAKIFFRALRVKLGRKKIVYQNLKDVLEDLLKEEYIDQDQYKAYMKIKSGESYEKVRDHCLKSRDGKEAVRIAKWYASMNKVHIYRDTINYWLTKANEFGVKICLLDGPDINDRENIWKKRDSSIF